MIQFINTAIILGLFALCVDGKHIQQKASAAELHKNVVAEYAAPEKAAYGLTKHQAVMLAALARHMSKGAR